MTKKDAEVHTYISDVQAPEHNCPRCGKDHPCGMWPQAECSGLWCYCRECNESRT